MAHRKKVLLITYYWPPAGGAGVQRWLKMSRYLQEHFDLTVYHPENATYPILDPSLEQDIPKNIQTISRNIQEPYFLANKLDSKTRSYQKGQIEPKEKQSTLSKTALWIRANIFVPDARAWWIMPSFRYLKKYLHQHPQDVIITTGPPHSMHVIGLRLKLAMPELNWIADFRDPWTDIDYFDKLPMMSSVVKKHFKLEHEVLKYADIVTTVSPSWADKLASKEGKDVEVVYNGYDTEDFITKYKTDAKFTFTYIGSLNDDRNPSILWKVLDELCTDKQFYHEFELKLIGNVSNHVKTEISSHELLRNKTIFKSYIPHQDAIEELMRSHILLLLINATPNEKGIIPGKFFEYLAANRTILCLGKADSDIAKLLNKLKAGVLVERNDMVKLKKIILIWFKEYQNGVLNQTNYRNTSLYSRKSAAYEYIQMIEKL